LFDAERITRLLCFIQNMSCIFYHCSGIILTILTAPSDCRQKKYYPAAKEEASHVSD
jgi:hypothetical protein